MVNNYTNNNQCDLLTIQSSKACAVNNTRGEIYRDLPRFTDSALRMKFACDIHHKFTGLQQVQEG